MPATQALHSNTLHAAYVGIEWRRDNLHALLSRSIAKGVEVRASGPTKAALRRSFIDNPASFQRLARQFQVINKTAWRR
jgi:hypothetical protein